MSQSSSAEPSLTFSPPIPSLPYCYFDYPPADGGTGSSREINFPSFLDGHAQHFFPVVGNFAHNRSHWEDEVECQQTQVGSEAGRAASAKRRRKGTRFSCMVAGCKSNFTTKQRLECESYPYTFELPSLSVPVSYSDHNDAHNGVKRYRCMRCSREFRQCCDKKRHERTCKLKNQCRSKTAQ